MFSVHNLNLDGLPRRIALRLEEAPSSAKRLLSSPRLEKLVIIMDDYYYPKTRHTPFYNTLRYAPLLCCSMKQKARPRPTSSISSWQRHVMIQSFNLYYLNSFLSDDHFLCDV